MATTLANVLAGIGSKRTPVTPTAVASAGYAPGMAMQMRQILQSYKAVLDSIDTALPDIMVEALEPTLELAKKYTPKDTHALVNSGYLEKRPGAQGINVNIGFAKGGVPEYAVLVHERVDVYHKPPTRAKFLAAAMNEDQANVYHRLLVRCKI